MCGTRRVQVSGTSKVRGALVEPAAPQPDLVSRSSRLRIGDTERDAVVELLGAAFAEGYLDRSELDVRTERALAATTGAELEAVRRDLPARLDPVEATAVRERHQAAERGARAHLTSYAAGVALMVGIWLVTAVVFGATYFWPVWPILGWGIGVVSHVVPVRRQLGQTGPALSR